MPLSCGSAKNASVNAKKGSVSVAWTIPWNLIGLAVSGDVGDVTIYRNKNQKVVVFPKDMRQDKQSARRLEQQSRFRIAQSNWSALTNQEKQDLEKMSKILYLPATGQNVYISVQLRNDVEGYETLSRQSGVDLPAWSFVPYT